MRWMLTVAMVLGLGLSAAAADDEVGAPKPFDSKWRELRDPADIETAFLKLLPEARKRGDADHLAQLLSQIARTHSTRGSFEAAHNVLDQAEVVLGDAQGVGRVRVLLERGRAHNSNKELVKATAIFTKAFELAVKIKADFYVVDAAHMLGISEEPAKALEWNVKAIKLAEDSKSQHAKKWLGTLYNNTGWTYFEAADYTKALDFFTRSVAFRRERKTSDAVARWSKAKALRMLKRHDDALAMQRKLETEYKDKRTPDGFVFEEIAELLLITGKKDQARPYFKRAYEALQKISWVKSDTQRMDRLRTQAGLADEAKPAADDESSDDESSDDEDQDGE